MTDRVSTDNQPTPRGHASDGPMLATALPTRPVITLAVDVPAPPHSPGAVA